MGKPLIIRDLLNNLNKILQTVGAKYLSAIGITVPQMLVLRQIAKEAKTIGQISKAVGLSYSTVSGIIDRLEREGYVVRERDRADRRLVWIRRTPKIDEKLNQLPFHQEEYYAELLKDLSDEQLDSVIETLKMLTNQLEKKVEEKK